MNLFDLKSNPELQNALRELGSTSAFPVWIKHRLELLIEGITDPEFDKDELDEFRGALHELRKALEAAGLTFTVEIRKTEHHETEGNPEK